MSEQTKEQKIAIKEIERQYTSKKKNIGSKSIKFVKENASKLLIIPAVIMYIVYGLFYIERKDASLLDILGDIGVGLLMGTLIYVSLMNAGFNDAKKTEEYKLINSTYDTTKETAIEHQKLLPNFCNMKNEQEIKNRKLAILQNANLDYTAWELGYYDKHPEVLNKEKIEALNEIKNIKINNLNASDLMTKGNKVSEKYGLFGRKKSDYVLRKNFQTILTSVTIAIIFGYYGIKPIVMNQDLLAQVVWNTIQVIVWLFLGFLKYMDAKAFIIDEYCENNINKKTLYLKEFLIMVDKHPTELENYETEEAKKIKEFINNKKKEKEQNE